jgi:enoyl-CoA hydratase
MSWTIEERDSAALVTMTSNPVNKMNPAFFDDLHEAFDALDRRHPRLPVVLTAQGGTFSAGLDFADVFPRFARGDLDEVARWFDRFKSSILRVFTSPRRTVGALNGNAFAGGLILALSCDVRIGTEGGSRFAINEVPVGIPMPATYTEIVRYAIGDAAAAEAILSGRIYDVAAARQAGFLHRVVSADTLVDEALAEARRIAPDCAPAYATSKKILHHPTMQRLAAAASELDREAMRTVLAPESVRAQQAAFARLASKSR